MFLFTTPIQLHTAGRGFASLAGRFYSDELVHADMLFFLSESANPNRP